MIDGRAVYVEQVLRNLLSNAEKYSPRDTTIIIRIAIDRVQRWGDVAPEPPTGQAVPGTTARGAASTTDS